MKFYKPMIIVIAVAAWQVATVACNNDKADESDEDSSVGAGPSGSPTDGDGGNETMSYVLQSLTDLPPCDGGILGQLAYVKDEAKFYTCAAGTLAWEVIDIQGPKGDQGPQGEQGPAGSGGGGISVYRTGGAKVGRLLLTNRHNQLAIILSNGGVGLFETANGRYVGGLCASDNDMEGCNSEMFYAVSDNCAFDNASCTGHCYFQNQPLPNSIFVRSNGTYVRANGAEPVVNAALSHIWNPMSNSCDAMTADNYDVYKITNGTQVYTFPSGLSSPLSPGGTLYFGE